MENKTVFLLDAYALAYRSYYAFINSPRINSKGENTSAVFGFTNTLLEVLNKQKPSHIGVVFDTHGPTFRHQMFANYKANREAMPEDLRQSIPYIKQMIAAMNIPVISLAGYEADDIIGTLAYKFKNIGFKVFMMTPDKDYAQLVSDNIFVFKPARSGNDAEIWDEKAVVEKFNVTPSKIVDLLGLMGDASDNIPGCPGVGPKGAEKLITAFGSIEDVYQNIEQQKGKIKDNLLQFKDQVILSKKLATIDTNVPVDFNPDLFIINQPDSQKITELFDKLEFKNLLPRVLGAHTPINQKKSPNSPIQGSLFDNFEPAVNVEQTYKTIDTEKPNYIIADTPGKQTNLLNLLLKIDKACFDTETTSLDIHTAQLVGMSFAIEKGTAWYVPVPEQQTEAQNVVDFFRPFFENPNIAKIGQNIKYDLSVLLNYNIDLKGHFYDTMLMHYLIQPEQRHNLDLLARKYLHYQNITTEELIGKKGKNQKNMRQVDVDIVAKYACEDADITLQLFPILYNELALYKMTELYNTIEAPLIKVLAHMEYAGVCIDTNHLNNYSIELNNEVNKIEDEIYALAGEKFNISSPKQLGEILFDKLAIASDAKLTKTKQYQTGEDILSKLTDKHPIVNLVLEYRSLKKLISTYVEALPGLVNKKTGRIHTSYNQTITATGRLSSNNPNLQNIPIREQRGREIRKAFIPCSKNHVIISADYSQIELRIMAHLCNDQNMVDAFKNGFDIHSATAARIFNTDINNVSREQRSKAKGANFGIIYGISSFGLSQNLNLTRSEAKTIIDSYFENYPKVKTYMDQSIANARQTGFTSTIFGRRRYLSDINSTNAIVRGTAERNAINAPIQGTAADIIKIAMINIFNDIKNLGLKTQMIMQVHDELVFNVPINEAEQVKNLIIKHMESATTLIVPLTVDCNAANNWLGAH